jgi:hypothetical protein
MVIIKKYATPSGQINWHCANYIGPERVIVIEKEKENRTLLLPVKVFFAVLMMHPCFVNGSPWVPS